MKDERYYRYSTYLKERYGQRVYKLPVHIPVSWPNREGEGKGCIYCGILGAGFEQNSGVLSVQEQLEGNMGYIGRRYKATAFIAYFQSFTNTYLPVETFQKYMMEAAKTEGIVEIAVSTRPDCIRKEYLEVLLKIKQTYDVEITVELGLQTANYHTLEKVNRGHTLGEYIESAFLIKSFGFQLCTHLILNLPWDDTLDVVESAKIASACQCDFIKLHALYIEKGTELAKMYEHSEFSIGSLEEYRQRVVLFLEHLSPKIAVQRIIGRAPEEETLFANWGQSWWKIHDEILEDMEKTQSFQGKSYHYLGGSGVRKFFD